MSSVDSRIIHLHIPKTAGTAIRVAFRTAGEQAFSIFPHYDEKLFTNADADAFDLFSGHFGYETGSSLGGRLITVLRDPVDRFVSVYYFWRQLYEQGIERNRKTAMAVRYGLHDFARIRDEPVLAEEFFNRATWQIAVGSSMRHRSQGRDVGITDAQLLERATSNLATFAAVGFQDDLDPFRQAVSRLCGVDLRVRQVNVTRDRVAAADIAAPTRRLIEDWVYLDMELITKARAARPA